MGLIADIVESVKNAFTDFGTGVPDDFIRMGAAFRTAGDVLVNTDAGAKLIIEQFGIDDFLGFPAEALTDPKVFAEALFNKWNLALQGGLAVLNVDAVEGPAEAGELPVEQIRRELELGRQGAQVRVTTLVSIINFILVTGNAISVIAEFATVGRIRSIAEAIQSWVWANGVGGFSSMMFTPQIEASLNPLLRQFYNKRAKAQIPPVSDTIRFQLREVFLPGRREELIGEEDRPVFNELMAMNGFSEFHADSYWGAHWQLPATGQLNEMLHRGVIDRDTWERFVRFNDIEPTTIPWLADIIFNPFTRVDVRRMARLGVLTDDEVLQAYADVGFFAPTRTDADGRIRAVSVENPDFTVHKAQALQVFTRVFNVVPELRQRFSKGWIDAGEVRQGLLGTGIPAERANTIAETIIRNEAPARIAPEKELTRALITRAWKLRLISFTQAQFLIMRLGFDFNESELILRVVSEFDDPLSFVDTSLGVRLGAGGSPPIDDFEGI